MSNVSWVLKKDPIDVNNIITLEKHFGIEFPVDYKECVLENNGGRPRPNVFDSENRIELIAKSLLSLNKKDPENIWESHVRIKDRLPQNVIPFMSDQFGNYLCFDYRQSPSPSVVFWDHELINVKSQKAITHVANSYTEFLNGIYQI